jgi:CheY-like chemotaxis protein
MTNRTQAADGKRSILLADDDEEFRTALADALAEEGYSIEQAIDGADALAKLTKRRPAIILIDLLMPSMSGLELLQRMRRTPKLRDIPAVVITGANDAMLSIKLDVPVVYKGDFEAVLTTIRQYVTGAAPS